jgi:hypothetical protein
MMPSPQTFTNASTLASIVAWSPDVAQPPLASVAPHFRPNLASAAERQRGSSVPIVAAFA